jgi:formate--tetrahydrofolate ligase
MEDITLHFTGDFHAIGAANNLLAAMIDNHIHQGNELGFALDKIVWKRCVDMNDRVLRKVTVGLGGKANGVPREDGYDITVASEVMAILCLASGLGDLKERLGRIVVGYTEDDRPITAKDLKAHGAMAALLKDAIRPNLVQTLEHTPVLIHGGPFANIAHGCNSVLATKLAQKLGDYVVTEAGFGADLGAEKFFDIKCRMADLRPAAVVLVATVRALKYHGGVEKDNLTEENVAALIAGFPNLLRHADNIRDVFGLPCVVAINRFPSDTDAELNLLHELCAAHNLDTVVSEVWEKGGAGGIALAERVIELCEQPNRFRFCYSADSPIEEKLNAIARRIYHADGVIFTESAHAELNRLKALGFGTLPVCVAKTQYSFSDDPKKRGVPSGFRVTVRKLRVAAGAGFVIALTGSIMTMPGLPKHPAAEQIDVDENGTIVGLF